MNETPRRGVTSWTLLTGALGVPVWWAVASLGVMPRSSQDGGIFISVVGGIRAGLPLYSGVWDNKDPLFFLAMAGASILNPSLMLVMDWAWLLIGAVGTWMLARAVMSEDRAVFAGAILSPIILLAPFHEAGMSSLPGTVVAALALGLLLNRWAVAGGIAVGLLVFLKLIVWPVVVVAMVAMLFVPSLRRVALRGLIAMAGTLALGLVALFAAGWLGPYLDALIRNRTYASDVIVYFGYEDSPIGHLQRLADDWSALASPVAAWTAVAGIALTALGLLGLVAFAKGWRTPQRTLLAVWLAVAVVGTVGTLALTYVWGHHAQALYLPALLAVVGLLSLVPAGWVFPGFVATSLAGAWLLSGWGLPTDAWVQVDKARNHWVSNWATMSDVPTDDALLATVAKSDFTFARLGSNEDEGFLFSAPKGAHLACPQFHLYDFSPPVDFDRMLQCIQHVDVLLVTDSFRVFGNGGRAVSAQPILQYVDAQFSCMRVNDRQICTRKPA